MPSFRGFLIITLASICTLTALPASAQRKLPDPIKVPYPPGEENLNGPTAPFREPGTDRMFRLAFSTKGLGDTRHGAMSYKMWYQVSLDGGRTYDKLRPLIQEGAEYDRMHPIEPVYIAKNSYVYSTQPPSHASNGEIMVPFWFWPLDEKGELAHFDDGVYVFCAAGILIGNWNEAGTDIVWDLGETVHLDFDDQSTRGAMEPAIVELKTPGHFAMTLRASNSTKPEMPSYKWIAVSKDYCRTWSDPRPMTYADGSPFFSPSACSDIRRNSRNGKLYWFGNICEENADSNYPRYPLMIAEVDEESLGLIRDSVQIIDTRDAKRGDTEKVQFSNFHVQEDPQTGNYIVTLRRLDTGRLKKGESHRGHKWPRERYVIEIK